MCVRAARRTVLGLVGVMDIDVHLLGQAGIDLTKGPLKDPYGSAA
jgi:hypothetical protein